MSFATMYSNELSDSHLYLELSEAEQERAKQESNKKSSGVHYNAYLNALCLNAFLAWSEEEPDIETGKVWLSPDSPQQIWEFANGTAVTLGDTKLVLIPSEAEDMEELSVPQEWIDIPNWRADYYLAVRVDTTEAYLQIFGYATHQQLKEEGEYDFLDQSYSLPTEELTEDINVMLVARRYNPNTQAEVAPLPALSAAEVEGLMARLGQATPYSPRLDVPFCQWGALLSNEQWRSQLYQKRNAGVVKTSLIRLGEWLKGVTEESVEEVKTAWLTLEQLLQAEPQLALGHRSMKNINEQKVERWQVIDLDTNEGIRKIALLFIVTPDVNDTARLKIEVSSADNNVYLPHHLQLSVVDTASNIMLWDEALEVKTLDTKTIFGTIEEIETGDAIAIQLTLGEVSISKNVTL